MAPLRPHASAAHGTAPGSRASRTKNSDSQETSAQILKDECLVSRLSSSGKSWSQTGGKIFTENSCIPERQLEHFGGTSRGVQGPAPSESRSRNQPSGSKVSVASHLIDAKNAPIVSGSCRLKRKQQLNPSSVGKMMVSGDAITSRHVNEKEHPLKQLKPRQAAALQGKENVDPGFRISLSSSSAKTHIEGSGVLSSSVPDSLKSQWIAEEADVPEECNANNCPVTNANAGNVARDFGETRLSSSVPITDIIPPPMASTNTKRDTCQSDLYSKGTIKARKHVEAKKTSEHREEVSAAPGLQIPTLVEVQAAVQTFDPKSHALKSTQTEECPSVPVARAVPADAEGPLSISASARPADTTGTIQMHLESAPLVQLVRDDEEIWKEWEGIRLLGEGVYGRVYLVRNRSTQEERAFKRMYLHARRRSETSEKPVQDLGKTPNTAAIMAAAGGGTLPAVVQREVTVLRALRGQPNIIPLHGVLIGSYRVYLSFPLVKGGTLSDLLRCFAGWAENLRCNPGTKRKQRSGGQNQQQTTPQFPSGGICLCEALRGAPQLDGYHSRESNMAGEQRSSTMTRASSNVSPETAHTQSRDSWTSPGSECTPTHGDINTNDEKPRPSQCTELSCACPCRRCIPQCGLPLGLCLRVAHALLRGIAACHEKRIVHRDLKPDNVLVQWTEVPMDQTRCKRTLEYMEGIGSVKERSPAADVSPKRRGSDHTQVPSATDATKDHVDYAASVDTYKSTENSQDDECLLPPPLVQRLYIADFGLARTLPFFTSPYCPKEIGSPSAESSQQLPTPDPHDVAGQETPETRRADALVGTPPCNGKQTPSIEDGDGASGVCLSPEIITLNYRPLEVLLGSSTYTLAVDIWSVGCVVLECLTGREFVDGCCEMSCILHILQTFGTPDEKEWPQLFRLPFMSRLLPVFPKNPHAVEAYLAANGRTDVVQSENWMQMLNLLLQVNPEERISAAEALRLPLFSSVPDSAFL